MVISLCRSKKEAKTVHKSYEITMILAARCCTSVFPNIFNHIKLLSLITKAQVPFNNTKLEKCLIHLVGNHCCTSYSVSTRYRSIHFINTFIMLCFIALSSLWRYFPIFFPYWNDQFKPAYIFKLDQTSLHWSSWCYRIFKFKCMHLVDVFNPERLCIHCISSCIEPMTCIASATAGKNTSWLVTKLASIFIGLFNRVSHLKGTYGHFVVQCAQSAMLKSLWKEQHHLKLLTQNQSIWEL